MDEFEFRKGLDLPKDFFRDRRRNALMKFDIFINELKMYWIRTIDFLILNFVGLDIFFTHKV